MPGMYLPALLLILVPCLTAGLPAHADSAVATSASGLELDVSAGLLGQSADVLAVGPLPDVTVGASTPFAESDALISLSLTSPLGLISVSTGALAGEVVYGEHTGPVIAKGAVDDLNLAIAVLDLLGLTSLLNLVLEADAVSAVARIDGDCGALSASGITDIAGGQLTASLLGAIGVPLPIDASPPPNTGIDLNVLGLAGSTLMLNEQIMIGDGVTALSLTTSALRLELSINLMGLLTVHGGVVVAHAHATRNCNQVDLAVGHAGAPDPGMQGQPLTYTVTAFNQGAAPARGAEILFTRPDSTDFIQASAPGPCHTAGHNRMRCVIGDLAPGETGVALVTVTPSIAGYLLSRANIISADEELNIANTQHDLVMPVQAAMIVDSLFADRFTILPAHP